MSRPVTAIIGAGLAGLILAQRLTEAGQAVRVFDKGRKVGGRASARRTEFGHLDHGANYFTAKTPEFRAALDDWCARGWLAPWNARLGRLDAHGGFVAEDRARCVGVPVMNAPHVGLAENLAVAVEVEIAAIDGQPGDYRLRAKDAAVHGPFARVIVSVPPPQAAPLLAPVADDFAARARGVGAIPSWTLLAVADRPLPLDFDGATAPHQGIAWLNRVSSKPGRAEHASWIVQADAAWSREHLELDKDAAAQALSALFVERLLGGTAPEWRYRAAHRWRYAFPAQPLDAPLWDAARGIGACGDWCGGAGKLEAAYRSADDLAGRVLATASVITAVSNA